MKIRDLFHAQPTEFSTAHSTRHMVTGAIVHLHYEDLATRTRFDVITWNTHFKELNRSSSNSTHTTISWVHKKVEEIEVVGGNKARGLMCRYSGEPF